MVLTTIQPSSIYALTSGPSQPEFNSFTPIGTSDMVNLATGDFNYNIPIMDVGGYPLNLSYDSGVTMDQEASWVGLGWNLNVGQINRQVRGIPDDFKGDEIIYENDMKRNITVGTNVGVGAALAGFPVGLGLNMGMGVQYNNYEGITFKPSFGVSFGISDNVQVGMNISSSTAEGATASPRVNFNNRKQDVKEGDRSMGIGFGLTTNSRKGLESFSMSTSTSTAITKRDVTGATRSSSSTAGTGGAISFNTNNLYTPQKRAGIVNGNFSFNAAIGAEVLSVELDGHIYGYGSYQQIRNDEKIKSVPSFGYDFDEYANKGNSILDFNREKDRTFTKNTTVLPIVNQTYDIYAINGQGISGMFRPHRSQVGYMIDNKVSDNGDGGNLGGELGLGWNVHVGADTRISSSYSYSGGWEDNNYALSRFEESSTENTPALYEKTYFKKVGELNIDPEEEIFNTKVHGNTPMRFLLGGSNFNRKLEQSYQLKNYDNNGVPNYNEIASISSKIKRSKRDVRNSAIIKVTHAESEDDKFISNRAGAPEIIKPHHTAGIKSISTDGSTYIYGETAYNWSKEEVTVDVTGATNTSDCSTGLVDNNGEVASSNSSDRYLNRIITPAYAHTFLLSSILSSDYEDISQDGPSIDDLGSYTLFKYGEDEDHYIPEYNWRTPYSKNSDAGVANFNEGLKSVDNDQKGSIIRGKKELKYLRTIETKTHVAYFKLSSRQDGLEAKGGVGHHTKQIDNIYLFTRPEFNKLVDQIGGEENLEDEDENILSSYAIKTAHFNYSNELCRGIQNTSIEGEGKLTLKTLYFTYRDSKMGRYNPYTFNYEKDFDENGTIDNNPSYNIKGYDIWGNYKENKGDVNCNDINGALTTSEFPFVEQNKEIADVNTAAWALTSIDLPSGGRLEIETESDDYQFVQDRKAMQMFEVSGFSDTPPDPLGQSTTLYNGGDHKEYINIKISNENLDSINGSSYTGSNFLNDYLKENAHKPIYFRALLNMVKNTNTQYDYVSGYFEIDPKDGGITGDDFSVEANSTGTYVSIPLLMLEAEGGWIPGGGDVNPIAKAGWYFGRTNLNRVVYSISGDNTNDDFGSIVNDLVSSISGVFDIFTGPNLKLQERQCARNIIANKSWVRLENPDGRKYGGGSRVKKIQMFDQWGAMHLGSSYTDNPLYNNFYGQEYSYVLDDEKMTSSGVATFEPNSSKENPFVEPFYDTADTAKDKLVAPKESNYVEKPIGESFFPAAKITYSRVEVKNLEREENGEVVKKHATGKVVNEFYTSKDFPTKTDYTDISMNFDPPGTLANILDISVKNHLTFSQGFVVETNDMDGRPKSTRVYPEDQDAFISGVDYKYNIDDEGNLSNQITTIDKNSVVRTDSEMGLTYDVYNDFRENYSDSRTVGFDFNTAGFVIFVIPVIIPMPIPTLAYHETKLRTASTTKVINRSVVMTEKTAFDLGSKVTTKNLAWDAVTGQVLLTETINEYDDYYYNFNYPSYWYYDGMGLATNNIGVQGTLSKQVDLHEYTLSGSGSNVTSLLTVGDELLITGNRFFGSRKAWVASVSNTNVVLMNSDGELLNDDCNPSTINFKVVRSGFRNQQNASMASVTGMVNPINGSSITESYQFAEGSSNENPRIVNASAIQYREAWGMQWEEGLPPFPHALNDLFNNIDYANPNSNPIPPQSYGFNPYLYNVRGEWRAQQSYAYLTGRASLTNSDASPRYEGFFKAFQPFYQHNNSGGWQIDTSNWTSASEVTQYSPYGAELENKDALNRYSSAQYGYNSTLPVAVASNSQYREMGFDGFEDYEYENPNQQDPDAHFSFYSSTALPDNTTAHSGRSSLAVTGETSITRSYEDDCYTSNYIDPDCTDPPDPNIVIANNDYYTVTAQAGESGTFVSNILNNDTFNGGSAVGNVTIDIPNSSGPLTVNSNGTVNIDINTPPGTYLITYEICDSQSQFNCSQATVEVEVDDWDPCANECPNPPDCDCETDVTIGDYGSGIGTTGLGFCGKCFFVTVNMPENEEELFVLFYEDVPGIINVGGDPCNSNYTSVGPIGVDGVGISITTTTIFEFKIINNPGQAGNTTRINFQVFVGNDDSGSPVYDSGVSGPVFEYEHEQTDC